MLRRGPPCSRSTACGRTRRAAHPPCSSPCRTPAPRCSSCSTSPGAASSRARWARSGPAPTSSASRTGTTSHPESTSSASPPRGGGSRRSRSSFNDRARFERHRESRVKHDSLRGVNRCSRSVMNITERLQRFADASLHRSRRLTLTAFATLALVAALFGTALAAQSYPFSDDMENTASGNWLADSPWASFTGDFHSGARCWTDSPGGYYATNADVSLAPAFSLNLSTAVHPVLRFWHHYDLEPGYDFGRVEASTNGGATWTLVKQYSGTEAVPFSGASLLTVPKTASQSPGTTAAQVYPNWVLEQLDLAAFVGQASVMFRFRLLSDASVQRDGWFIDAVAIAERPSPVTLSAIANPTSSSLDLSWTQSADPTFARYEIYRGSTVGVDFHQTLVATVTSRTSTTRTDIGLAAKSTYDYIVYTVSTLGTYAGSNVQAGTTLAGLTYPFTDNVEAGANWFASIPNTWHRITPDVAHSGTKIWTASQAGSYGNNWNTSLEIASPLTLRGTSALVFWERMGLLPGDSAFVET